jgi:molecular chaperone GrpE
MKLDASQALSVSKTTAKMPAETLASESDQETAASEESATLARPVPAEGTASEPPQAPPEPAAPQAAAAKTEADKAKDNWELLLRITADFENFKKRVARERQDTLKYANEALLQKLIPVLDNFDMAVSAAANAKEATAQSLQTGIGMILSQLRSILSDAGLEEIDATGVPFDPNFHEAVSQQETVEVPEGQVIQQLRKGYKLRDRLLRPASVVVARKPAM